MHSDERSRDVFEEIPGFEKPPLPPLPQLRDYADLERHGFLRVTPRSRSILDLALRASGYEKFHAELPTVVESVLRRTNMREGRLFGPAYSATVTLADDPRAIDPLKRAATLVVAARELCDELMSGKLSPDKWKGQPLEMGQYPNLFATSVSFRDGRARLYKSKTTDSILVMVRRQLTRLRIGAVGEASVEDIESALREIVVRASNAPPVDDDHAPGILASADAPTLRAALRTMEADPANAASLDKARRSLFVLCLDLESSPRDIAEVASLTHAGNLANRWHLASFQLVVFGNAKAGGICSFPAYLDGNVMMRSAAELQRRAARVPLAGQGKSVRLPEPENLRWNLDARLVRRAARDIRRIRRAQQATFEIRGIGREKLARSGLDPVSLFTVALALAVHRCVKRIPNIIQLLTVSRYRCVPVSGALVTTPAVRRFVELVMKGAVSAELWAPLRDAVQSELAECRTERSKLSLRWTLEGYIRTRRGISRALVSAVFASSVAALRAAGCLERDRIIISHPEIFAEVGMLGRPGVCLPYVSHLGLHYQIFADHIIFTVAPGKKWNVLNASFSRELERALELVTEIAASSNVQTSSDALAKQG